MTGYSEIKRELLKTDDITHTEGRMAWCITYDDAWTSKVKNNLTFIFHTVTDENTHKHFL
jgi:hypothetical protein